MARPVATLEMLPEEKRELERRVRASTTPQRECLRARIALLRHEGIKQVEVARRLGTSVASVNKWSQRFDREGIAGLNDLPRPGRPRSIPAEIVKEVVTLAGQAPPDARRWSTRSLAAKVGIAPSSVGRIWREQGLKPHDSETFELSTEKRFQPWFWDVVGLYLAPSDKAVVLCSDKETQWHGVGRTDETPPLVKGRIATKPHDNVRQDTISLFAAMSYLEGKLINHAKKKQRHLAWLRFLKQIDHEVPPDLDIHLIAGNCSTHRHKNVLKWLGRRDRFHMHFTPSSSSWMDEVERFYADLPADCLRAPSFTSGKELTASITAYIERLKEIPQPYTWKASGEKILTNLHQARRAIEMTANYV